MVQVQCAQGGCPGQQERGCPGNPEREDIAELESKTEVLNPGRIHQSYLGSLSKY